MSRLEMDGAPPPPDHPPGLVEAEAAWERGRLDEATSALRSALRAAPTNDHVWRRYGNARKAAGDDRGAGQAYRVALALDPALAIVWRQYGNLFRGAGESGAAVTAYRRSLIGEVSADTAMQMILAHRALSDDAGAVRMARLSITAAPSDSPGIWRQLAELSGVDDGAGAAETAWRVALTLDPDHAPTRHNLAVLGILKSACPTDAIGPRSVHPTDAIG